MFLSFHYKTPIYGILATLRHIERIVIKQEVFPEWTFPKYWKNSRFTVNTYKTLLPKKPVPNNFPKFTGKHLWLSNFLLTCLIIALHFYLKETLKNVRATSKTWTRTLDSDPGPWKTWTLINLDAEKPGPWNADEIQLEPEKQSEDHLA